MPCSLANALPPHEIAVESDVVARALGLARGAFRQLMEAHRIAIQCECGSGEDEGLYRATFYYGPHYARLLVNRDGHMVAPVAVDED
ncbi:MAG TPA: DUF6522 family protein [Lysobacter sp.]|nr:DUF6522 family protein [Lysobacter sp.]